MLLESYKFQRSPSSLRSEAAQRNPRNTNTQRTPRFTLLFIFPSFLSFSHTMKSYQLIQKYLTNICRSAQTFSAQKTSTAMAEEGHASGSLLNASNLQSTGKKRPVDVTDPLRTNGHKAPAYQWLRKFISEKSSVAIPISKVGRGMLQEMEKSVLIQCTTACL